MMNNAFGVNLDPDLYKNSIKTIDDLGIENCRLLSSDWTLVNYFDRTTEPFPREDLIQRNIDEGVSYSFL